MTPPSTTTVERLAQSRVQCTVTFTEEQRARGEQRALEQLGGDVKIDGFRPGKAPADLLKQRVNPERLVEETIRTLLPETVTAIANEHKVTSIIPPRIEVTSESPLTIRITFVEKPPVRLKGVGKISVEKKSIPVEDKDVERVVQAMREEYKTTTPVERAVQPTDQVTVDFWAEAEGAERVPELTATQYAAIIGSKTLLPGMEDGMVGMQKGETKKIAITLPEKHQLERLRGKQLTLHVTVTAVEQVQVPEFTDAFVAETFKIPTVAALKAEVRATLEREEENGERLRRERTLLDEIRKATTVELAPELLEAEERVMVEDLRQRLEEQNMDFAEWVKRSGKTNEEVAKDLRERATERLTLRFGLEKLIEEKGVTVSDSDIDGAIKQQLQRFPEDQRIEAAGMFQKGEDAYLQLEWQLRVEKALAEYLA